MDEGKDAPVADESACPVCGCYDNRAVTVDGVIIRDGKLLLIKRKNEPFRGYWAFPGGYLGKNETLGEAVLREVLEECGVEGRILWQLSIRSDPGRHIHQALSVPYVVEIFGEPVAGDDAEGLGWFDLDALPETLAFDHLLIIQEYLALSSGLDTVVAG